MKIISSYYCFIGALVLACAGVVAGDDTTKPAVAPQKRIERQAATNSFDHAILQRLEGQLIEPQGTNLQLHGRFFLDLAGTKDAGLDATQPVDLNGTFSVNDLIVGVKEQPFTPLVLLQPTEQAAYMGVGVESPGETLRAQLALPQGTGLVVNYVDDNGPAKNSVQKHDVLQKLDDQLLVNADQLIALVRLHKPGEKVSLTLMRQARQISSEVELGTKKTTDEAIDLGVQLERINRASTDLTVDGSGIEHLSRLPVLGRLYSNQVEGRPITFNDGEVLALLDGHGNLLAVEVKTGKILFQGPVGTDAQWKQAPARIRQKLTEWRSVIAPGNSDSSKSAEDHKDAGEPKPQ